MNKGDLARIVKEELELYDRHEHELAWGLEIPDSEDRARHEALKARIEAGMSFLDALVEHEVNRYLKERRPSGMFRADGIIPLSEELQVEMPMATREHLLKWASVETDERNLAYIKSRLALWEPRHATLADVERDKFS